LTDFNNIKVYLIYLSEKWGVLYKGVSPEIKQLNLYLEKVKLKIHHFYDEMILQQKPVSAEILKEKFLGKDRSAPTLLQLLKYHHDINKDVLTPGTMKNYVTTKPTSGVF